MRTTVIFDSFGPYHQARLRAYARTCRLTALQVAARSAEYAWENEGRAEGFDLSTLFPETTSRQASARQVVRRMRAALDASKPEVVVIPGWSSRAALTALQWCSKQNVPAILMSESTAWDEKRARWKEVIKRRIVTLCASALVGGRAHADYVVQLGMPRDRVALGYDAVDNDYFRQKAAEIRKQAGSIRRNHGLPENYFLASSRFIEKKNLPRLLQAYAQYRTVWGRDASELSHEKAPAPWPLVLLGDGALRPALCSQIAQLCLQDHVLLPGFRQYADLPIYYALASVFIHASTVEPWGLVVNEAMASGLPVLVSNRCGCAADLVHEGSNGFTFDPHDVEAIAKLMLRMSSMRAEVRNAWGAASESIIADWGPHRFATGLDTAAREAVTKGAVRRRTAVDRLLCHGLLWFPLPHHGPGLEGGAGWNMGRLFGKHLDDLHAAATKSSESGGSPHRSRPAYLVPNFFIIGAPKSGTTALSEYLKDHPNIFFSSIKEPHFFDLDFSKRLKLNLPTYLSMFSEAQPGLHLAVGEGSTGYLRSQVAVAEILKFNPNSKFIVMLRNPVELVQAWYSEMYFEGVENIPDFEQAWKLEQERRQGRSIPPSCWEPKKLFYSEWGRLGDQVERLFSLVPRERVKVILFDDFVADTKGAYEDVLSFLGVSCDGRTDFQVVNPRKMPRNPWLQQVLAFTTNYFRRARVLSGLKLSLGTGMSQKLLLLNSKPWPGRGISAGLEAELADFFHADVQKLSKLLDRDLSNWGSKTHESGGMDKGSPSRVS